MSEQIKKPDHVKIINIVMRENITLGLGDDNMVYAWRADLHMWHLWA